MSKYYRSDEFKPNRIIYFKDGFGIPVRYIDIVADIRYAYYNTNVDWQLSIFYTFYSEAFRRLKNMGYITDSQYESLRNMNCKLYRGRLQ